MKKSGGKIIVLEAYDPAGGYYDGLSITHGMTRSIGEPVSDTSGIAGEKVLVCGIPFLYEKRLSSSNTNIIYTTFESDRLPEFWVGSLNAHYHYCVVPDTDIKSVFRNSGVQIPIEVIPMGFSRFDRNPDVPPVKKDFTVGFLGVPVNRKNLIKLYNACYRLRKEKIPELRLSVHVAILYDWLDHKKFAEVKNAAFVEWTTGKYDERQLAAWYGSLSCYIFPSSGEGWSCTPRESLYMGVPTILSDIPAHGELIESDFCGVIPNAGKEPADFDGRCYGQWAKIKEDDIANAILEVYKNYPHYLARAASGASWISDKWQYEQLSRGLQEFICAI